MSDDPDPSDAEQSGSADDGAESVSGAGAERNAVQVWGDRVAGAARAHPNRTVFIVGAVLFASGLVGVVGSQTGSDAISDMISDLPAPTSQAAAAVVGPSMGEQVEPYMASKRALLAERAESDPGVSTLALIVFNSYKTAAETRQFLAARSLTGLAAQVRAPVDGVQPAHVPLVGRSLDDAAVQQAGSIGQQLEILEQIASEAGGDEYRQIYRRQLEHHRQAAALLDQPSPATIFAVVAHTSYAAFSQIAGAPEVRYIDVPVDPTVALHETSFAAIVPEDVDRVTLSP